MSEKPSPKSSGPKPPVKTAGGATSTGAKGASATAKSKPSGDQDDNFDFLKAAQSADELGRLANYRILKVLGRGGMGIVFMAEDTRLHRVVALKVMLPSIATKAVARDRFLREARATAAIEHDHIVTIYEVNEDNDVPYLAMQFLKGMTVEDWLKAGKTFNIPQIMRIGREIAKALAAAHACELIHRDIKPSNIWLDVANKGRVKILDFGLARPTNEETHLTQEGMILGSPAYMSPEQARGQNVDERCDLFSLGCVLYRLCAGKLPFGGKDAMSMLLAITSEEPAPLGPINADLPAELVELIHQLLAKKPEARPASAKSVVQTIQNIERDWIANGKTQTIRTGPNAGAAPLKQDQTIGVDKVDVDPLLEESAITELELQATEPPDTTTAPAPRRGSWLFAGLGCSLMTLVSFLCCLGLVVTTNHGHVKIVMEDERAKRIFENGELKVRDEKNLLLTLKNGTQKLPAGKYDIVDLETVPPGLLIEPLKFTINRQETLEIKIRYLAPPTIGLLTGEDAKRLQGEWAEYLKRRVIEKSRELPKMILIPPGEFLMGSTKEQIDRHLGDVGKKFEKKWPPEYAKRALTELPQHKIRISKPFYISVNEVTIGQFSRFRNFGAGYVTEPEASGKGGTGVEGGREVPRKREFNWLNPGYTPSVEHPVTNITWKDAEAYCAWLSEKEKKTYRLPSEAEWEYACRAGTTTTWSFADELRDVNARDYMWFHSFQPGGKQNSPLTPHAVGKKKANEFGLHDMHGNVAEMCSDYFAPGYYERCVKEGIVVDPKGPDPKEAPGSQRVVRGGSFLDFPQMARSGFRSSVDSTYGYCQIGFRIVCEVPLPVE